MSTTIQPPCSRWPESAAETRASLRRTLWPQFDSTRQPPRSPCNSRYRSTLAKQRKLDTQTRLRFTLVMNFCLLLNNSCTRDYWGSKLASSSRAESSRSWSPWLASRRIETINMKILLRHNLLTCLNLQPRIGNIPWAIYAVGTGGKSRIGEAADRVVTKFLNHSI